MNDLLVRAFSGLDDKQSKFVLGYWFSSESGTSLVLCSLINARMLCTGCGLCGSLGNPLVDMAACFLDSLFWFPLLVVAYVLVVAYLFWYLWLPMSGLCTG